MTSDDDADKRSDVQKSVDKLNAIHDVFVAARAKSSVIAGPEDIYDGDDPVQIAQAKEVWDLIISEDPGKVN